MRKPTLIGCIAVVILARSGWGADVSHASRQWTFEEARKHWRPMSKAVQHVGVPGCQWQTAVAWDGSLIFRGNAHKEETAYLGNHGLHLCPAYGDPMVFVDRTGTSDAGIRKGLEEGRLPIPWLLVRDGDLLWQERVFAHMLDRELEDAMQPRQGDLTVTHACWNVKNAGRLSRKAHLWLCLGDLSKFRFGYKCTAGDDLPKPLSHALENSLGITDGKVRYAIPKPRKGQVRQHKQMLPPKGLKQPPENVVEWEVELVPGEEADFRILIPYGLVDKATGQRIAGLDSEACFAQVRSFWREIVHRKGQIVTPDPFINDYLAAVAGQMAQQAAYHHHPGFWLYKTSPNHYEQYWPCNAAKALPALDFRGLSGLNRRILKSFVDMQTDDTGGLDRTRAGQGEKVSGEGYARQHGFLGNFREWTANPLLLSHGLAMWALAAHFRITRDRGWLGEGAGSPLQAMLDGFDWVMLQRRRTMREDNGRKVAHWGLLPAASAHDWLAGNTIFNDAFCIYGMAEVVRLLREIDHPRADETARRLQEYRTCLRERYAEARNRARPLPLRDAAALPYVPRVVQELDWAKIDWTYTGYGPLRAAAWGALDPHDELANQAMAFLDAGMPKAEGHYLPVRSGADENFRDVSDPSADRHYLWRHYVEYETMWPIGGHLFLARDDPDRFFEFLFHNLAAVLHHDYRVGVESLDGVPSCAPGDGDRWQLIRRMFVNDEYGGWDGSQRDLFLLQAIPRSWLKPGDRMTVKDMGTFFGGTMNLEVQVTNDGKSAAVQADFELAVLPERIRMRLRSGDGRAPARAEINGEQTAVLPGDVIALPQSRKGNYRIVGHF